MVTVSRIGVNSNDTKYPEGLHGKQFALLTFDATPFKIGSYWAGVLQDRISVTDQKTYYEEVGRRIREARKRRKPKLTQQGLAELVSLTRTSITNVEKGRQKFLLHTLADIAGALQVDPASLLPDSNAEPSRHLDKALKDRPRSEKEWIKSAVSASQKGRSNAGA